MKSKASTDFFLPLSLTNQLRSYHAKNEGGRYNGLIVKAIKDFCKNNFDDLIATCQKDSSIAKICNLPLAELEQYWRAEYPIENDDGTDYFLQLLKVHAQKEDDSDSFEHELSKSSS